MQERIDLIVKILDEKKAACHWFYAAKKCHPKHPLILENERFHKKGILSD